MYIIPSHKFAFIAAPRTGSKAVAQALMEQLDAQLVGSHHTTPNDHDLDLKGWTVCSTIRNHWDAMVSWWFKIERKQRAMTPLADFLPRFCANNPGLVMGNRLYCKSLEHTTDVLRYGWLEADLNQALVKCELDPVDLPRVVDSTRGQRSYQMFYKTSTAQWVGAYFAEEIEELGFKF